MNRLLKSKRGVTLVELVIGLLLISIFTLMTSSLLPPALRILASTKESSDLNVLVNNLSEYFYNEIVSAVNDDFPIPPTAPKATLFIEKKGGEEAEFSLSNATHPQGQGYLLKGGNMVYDPGYYKGLVISSLNFEKDDIQKFLTVTFSLSGQVGTTKTIKIKPYYYR